jgi:hypothetical protein
MMARVCSVIGTGQNGICTLIAFDAPLWISAVVESI